MSKLKKALFGGVFASVIAFAPIATADPKFEVTPVSQAGLPGSLIHNPMAIEWEPEGGNKRVSIVESEGVPGGQAIKFQVKRKNIKKPWNTRMRAPFDKDISSGEQIEIYFWARASKLPKGRDAGKIGVVLGRDREPYDTVVNEEIMPTSEWKMYRVSGTAERNFGADESLMGFDMAFAKQTIEFGPFYVVTLGQNDGAGN